MHTESIASILARAERRVVAMLGVAPSGRLSDRAITRTGDWPEGANSETEWSVAPAGGPDRLTTPAATEKGSARGAADAGKVGAGLNGLTGPAILGETGAEQETPPTAREEGHFGGAAGGVVVMTPTSPGAREWRS